MLPLLQKLVISAKNPNVQTFYSTLKSVCPYTIPSIRNLLAQNNYQKILTVGGQISRHCFSSTTNGSSVANRGDHTKPIRKYLRGLRIRLNNFLGHRQRLDHSAGGGGHHWKQWLSNRRKWTGGGKLRMTVLQRKTEAEVAEEVPKGLFKKLKYYLKRYWYIALPVHTLVCAIWFAGLYLAVQSGLDVVALLECLHMPDNWVEKVRKMPKAAGSLAAALVLYKVVTPLRYACSIIGIKLAFNWLKRVGLLRTARQLQLKGMEKTEALRRRLQERRKMAKMEHEKRRKSGKNGNSEGNSGTSHKNGGND